MSTRKVYTPEFKTNAVFHFRLKRNKRSEDSRWNLSPAVWRVSKWG